MQNGITWLDEIQGFYRERAAIEKEYATRLNALVKESMKKKQKNAAHISVGDTPTLTPGNMERYGRIGSFVPRWLTEL